MLGVHLCGYDKDMLGYRKRKLREICNSRGGNEDDPAISREYFSRVTLGLRSLFTEGVWHFGGAGFVPIRKLTQFSRVWQEIVVRKYAFSRSTFGAWTFPRGWTIGTHLRYKEPEERTLILKISDEINRRFAEMGTVPFGIGGPEGSLPFILRPTGDLL